MINFNKRKTEFVAILSLMFVLGILFVNDNLYSNRIQIGIQNPPILREQIENVTPQAALNSTQNTISNVSNPFEVFATDISTSYRHKIVVDQQNNIHIAWISLLDNVFYRVFYQNNQSWSQVLNISAYGTFIQPTEQDRNIELAAHGNLLYMTWTRLGGFPTNRIFRAVLLGDQFVVNPTTSSSSDESNPSIQVSPRGDCIITFIRTYTPSNMPLMGMIHYASDSWSNWYYFTLVDTVQTETCGKGEFRFSWDANFNMHILFRAVGGAGGSSYPGIYYGRNDSRVGSVPLTTPIVSEANLIWVSNQVNIPFTTDLFIKTNSRTGFVYFGMTNGTSDKDVLIYNKTASANAFNLTACFEITDSSNTIMPDIAFDSQNKVIVVYYTDTQFVYYHSDMTQSATQIRTQNQFAVVAVGGLNDDVFIVSKNMVSVKLILTQIDRTGPSINVIYPGDNLAITGNMTFNVVVAKDTKVISYEWYSDLNRDGWVNDGGVWELINVSIAEVNYTDGSIATMLNFSHIWDLGSKDKFGIILRINGTDKNLLDQTLIFANITIDNNKPQICQITGIQDEFGINGFVQKYGRRNITVSFIATDNCSQVKIVELYNGTGQFRRKLADNLTGSPAFGTLVWQTDASWDGNYTDLYLEAYDNANLMNKSDSLALQNIHLYIDNTGPNITFLTIKQDEEYSRIVEINMLTDSADTRRVNVTYLDTQFNLYYINPFQYGNATLLQNGTYSINWTTNGTTPLHGIYIVNATAEDIYGNRQSTYLQLSIDNYGPNIQIINPKDVFKIGFIVDVLAYVDNDTVSWQLGYDTGSRATFNQLRNIRSNLPIINNGSTKILSQRLDLTGFSSGDFSIGIQTTDNQGYTTFKIVVGTFSNEIPKIPVIQTTSNSFYNTTTQKFAVRLYTYYNLNEINTMYRVYRSLTPFNVKYLNSLNASDRLEILGEKAGSKYCIGEVNASLLSSEERNYIPFTDSPIDPNIYYYIVMAFNQYGTPGNCTDNYQIAVVFPQPQKEINLEDIQLMPYVFGGVVILMAMISVIMVRGTKTVRREKAVKKTYENILDMEYNVENKEKAKTLTDRLDEIEASLSGTETKSKKQDIDVDDFLKMEVKEEKKESIIGSGGLRKCPGCGWTLSSTATKCPRCGRLLG